MPPTTLACTNRIDQLITILGLPHHIHLYCDLTSGGTGPSGTQTVPVLGFSSVNTEVAIDEFLTLISPFYKSTDAVFGPTTLDTRSGSQWVPEFTYSSTVLPVGTVGSNPGCQSTWFFYTAIVGAGGRRKLTVILPENEQPAPAKFTDLTSAPASYRAFRDAYIAPSSSSQPGAWQRQIGGYAIKSWLSLVVTTNRKTRRRRGLA